ncbi:MAG: universal stress protein [Armatimonadota bacterium]|nr:universal stress protein [bacterium]MDW8322373.1 universal stress protein [Armatimonadota bacterium]
MIQRILLATDGSETALKATRWAAELAKTYNAKVTVLHVVHIPAALAGSTVLPGGATDVAVVTRLMEQAAEGVITITVPLLEEAGVEYDSRIEYGHTADTIVRVAEEEKADLIVMGSRGLTDASALLLGSVSHKVLHVVHDKPVLIVR